MDNLDDATIAWIDFETTGLKPFGDTLPLEVGIILTDSNFDYIDDFSAVYDYSRDDVLRMKAEAPKVVYDMHHENGLWSDLETTAVRRDRTAMDDAVLEFLKKHEPRPRHVVLGGHSLRFDMNCVEAWMPKVYEHIHYRSLDMTGVGLLMKKWTGTELQRDDSGKVPHRALDDASLALSSAIGWQEVVESLSADSEAHTAILGWMKSVVEVSDA